MVQTESKTYFWKKNRIKVLNIDGISTSTHQHPAMHTSKPDMRRALYSIARILSARLYRTDLKHWKSNDLSIFRKMYRIPERITGPDRGLLYPFRKLDNRHIYKAHYTNRCVARPIKVSQRQCPAGPLHCLNHASTCSKHVKLARRH